MPVKIDTGGTWVPSFLPDGRHFLFFSAAPTQPENAGVVWADRAGRRIGNPGPKGVFNSLSLSPEATSVVDH